MNLRTLLVKTIYNAIFISLALAIFTYAVWYANALGDPDIYWHIEAGRWIVAHLDVPRVDIFSYTVAGQPWVDMEWLSQVILYAWFEAFGWRGLNTLNGLVAVLVWWVVAYRLQRYCRPAVALAWAIGAVWYASYHFVMRPHMLAMPFLILWTAEMAAAEEEDRHPRVWTLPMLLIWVQLHTGSILSIPIAMGFRQWQWAIWAIAIGMVTPYGYGYYEQVWVWHGMEDIFSAFIAELRPVNAVSDRARVAVLCALAGAGLWLGVRLRWNRALLVVGLTLVSVQHLRGLAILAFVLPFVVADGVRVQCAARMAATGRRAGIREAARAYRATRVQRLQLWWLSYRSWGADLH